eukprot:gene27905-36762_t
MEQVLGPSTITEAAPVLTSSLHRWKLPARSFLKQSSVPFHIFIIEQSDDNRKFNRGKLLNIGYDIAVKAHFKIHDVDLIPTSPALLPTYTHLPIHEQQQPAYTYCQALEFRTVNGFPNNFWGWGGEALIELLDAAPIITNWAVGKTTDTLLNEYVQNVAQIDEKKRVVGGTVTVESREFAFLSTFVSSGASGCGLYDDSGFIIGIVLSKTTDEMNGVMVPQGTYSIESLGSLFFRSLVDSRNDPVVSRILLFSKIEELLADDAALGYTIVHDRSNEQVVVMLLIVLVVVSALRESVLWIVRSIKCGEEICTGSL